MTESDLISVVVQISEEKKNNGRFPVYVLEPELINKGFSGSDLTLLKNHPDINTGRTINSIYYEHKNFARPVEVIEWKVRNTRSKRI